MKNGTENYTYLLRCADGSLYCGWTNDIDKRVRSHNAGTASKYTRVRRPVELAYLETFATKEEAMSREWHIKQLDRREKEELIAMYQKENAVTGTAAKAADRYAIDVLGIPSLELMECASRHVTDHILSIFCKNADVVRTDAGGDQNNAGSGQRDAGGTRKPVRAVILCSVGNNGADGVCVARQLLESEQDFSPAVLLCGNLEKATWEFLHQLSAWKQHGGSVKYLHDDSLTAGSAEDASAMLRDADVIVDAVFGIGLKRPVEGVFRRLIEAANAAPAGIPRIAVDVPSGINADDGRCMGVCFRADTTLTFGKNKTGLLEGEGPDAAGTVRVCGIGIPEEVYAIVSS